IKYRIEGFAFFVCNAWELMLKSELLKRNINIYFKDKPDRTLDLSSVIKKIYTNDKDPLRINLSKIIELRNTSTHYITEDYEIYYVPLFQACVLNFINEIKKFHHVEMTDYISENFMSLSTSLNELTEKEVKAKYSPELAQKLLINSKDIKDTEKQVGSQRFFIGIEQKLYITKSKDDADFTIKVDKNSNSRAKIIKELKDPAKTHKYTYHEIVNGVNDRLSALGIHFEYQNGNNDVTHKVFNNYIFNLAIKFYGIKDNSKYSYEHVIGKRCQWTYSQQLIEFIVNEIKKNPKDFVKFIRNNKKR
ncbi:MAG: DUF3644 domain-containing protein, partial [Oenococcus oeni]